MVNIPDDIYSDAKESRNELFNIKDFIENNKSLNKLLVDKIEFKSG